MFVAIVADMFSRHNVYMAGNERAQERHCGHDGWFAWTTRLVELTFLICRFRTVAVGGFGCVLGETHILKLSVSAVTWLRSGQSPHSQIASFGSVQLRFG